MNLALDHVVVAARRLDDGVAWCEATLGIAPGPGGRHEFMGTHNRLFSIASTRFMRAYFEIIAIDRDAAPPGRPRWFDLDRPGLHAALESGPKLVHWVARCDDLAQAQVELRAAGIDSGEILRAQRRTERGTLSWQITVRPDGRRLFGGAFPALIEWASVHPADGMQPSGVQLERIDLRGLPPALRDGWPNGVTQHDNGADARPAPPITITLSTPRGIVQLQALPDDDLR